MTKVRLGLVVLLVRLPSHIFCILLVLYYMYDIVLLLFKFYQISHKMLNEFGLKRLIASVTDSIIMMMNKVTG